MNRPILFILALMIFSPSFGHARSNALIEPLPSTLNAEDCDRLKEKIRIFSNLKESMVNDIMTVNDESLCAPLMKQCQVFYGTAVEYQNAYQKQCDPAYEKVAVESCYTADNECSKHYTASVTPVNARPVTYDNMVYYSPAERKFRRVYFSK